MDDNQFRTLLDYLGYSWSGYRKVRKGVKKRIRRHMQLLGCPNIYSYLDLLAHQAETRHACELLLTVSISRFLRDRRMWQMLEKKWLPGILARNPQQFRIWSAGCACGEEVYSFKVIWEHLRGDFNSLPFLHIVASDRNPEYLKRARCGEYNRSSLRAVPAADRAAFFESLRGGRAFAIRPDLKSGITWELRNLLNAPPARRFPIIFLRNNILTYCRQEVQMKAVMRVLDCLDPEGLLILGRHERLPFETAAFMPMDECPFVYRKR